MPNFGEPAINGSVLRRKALDFLKGKTPDHTGMMVDQYFAMTDEELESCHGWIQWAFPIDTVSLYNENAGRIFRGDSIVLDSYEYYTPLWHTRHRLVDLYLATIGIDLYAGTNVTKFFQVIDSPHNHHMKRISRVLTHLMITGNEYDARQLYKTLINDLVMRKPALFLPKTIAYWSAIVLEFDESTRELL